MVGVEERCTKGDNFSNEDYRDNVNDNDDYCIVSFPGASNSNGKNNIESGSDDDEYCYSNIRQCVKLGKYSNLFVRMI